MLIGIDASRAEASDKTGVERYSYEIIRALRESQPEGTRVILYSRRPLPTTLGPFTDKWQNRVLRWPFRFFWTQLRLSFALLIHRPDVLFVPSALLPRVTVKHTVTTIHDATFLAFPKLYPLIQRWKLRLGLHDAAMRADVLMVPSHFTAEQLASVRRTGIAVIPLGVRTQKETAPYTSPPIPYFLTVGRVDKKKNLPLAIDAFALFHKKHPEYQLKIVGRFDFGAADIVAHAQHSPAASHIVFEGAVSDDNLTAFYRGATALVHPCPVEGFGLPVIEAFSVGTPVIVAETGGAGEVAGAGALVVRVVEATAWAAAMEQALFDIFRSPLIEEGHRIALGFTWEQTAEETWKVLAK